VASAGGNPQTGKTIDPITGGGACATVADETAQNTAVYRAKVLAPFTIMGLPTVKAKIAVSGLAPQLDSRLWDIDAKGNQTLVTRGAFRVGDIPKDGVVTFQLHGNGWRFETGHTVNMAILDGAARALADTVPANRRGAEYIVPPIFDFRVSPAIAAAVVGAATSTEDE